VTWTLERPIVFTRGVRDIAMGSRDLTRSRSQLIMAPRHEAQVQPIEE